MARRLEIMGFRLILADPHIGGGTVMKTYKARPPSSCKRCFELMNEERHFKLDEILASRGLVMGQMNASRGVGRVIVTGRDGPRHVPIRSDDDLGEFFRGVEHTPLPSVEIQFPRHQVKPAAAAAPEPVATEAWAAAPATEESEKAAPTAPAAKRGSAPRDRQEELEDENFKLLRQVDKVQRQLDEVDRRLNSEHDWTERVVELVKKDLLKKQDETVDYLKAEVQMLLKNDADINKDKADLRAEVLKLEKKVDQNCEDINNRVKSLDAQTEQRFESLDTDIEGLRMKDNLLEEEDLRQTGVLKDHEKELNRLDLVKVEYKNWKAAEDEMQLHFDTECKNLNERLTESVQRIDKDMTTLRQDMNDGDTLLTNNLQKLSDRCDAEFATLAKNLEDGLAKAESKRAQLEAMIVSKVQSEVTSINERMTKGFKDFTNDINTKDAAINKKTDELKANTEKTFEVQWEHVEEMVRVERARMGTIERDMAEGFAKLRSDFRAEIERFRNEYDQNEGRMGEDLQDLHMKHDVTKQEINFFQSRLLEQRDWAQRQFTETQTATRAAQVDAQEGLSAAQKMLHALRDDAVSFREKMAKYISLLQHASDGHGDAISSLETHRGRMRLELDALMGDHKAYTSDMDGWADDVRVKVERLFRAMEPGKVEWKIKHAAQRLKELKRPLAIKSAIFGLKGMREAQMEFYPEGHTNTPEGKSCLRIIFPPNCQVRYQAWLGKDSEGALDYGRGEYGAGNQPPLTVDLFFDSWKPQVREDGSVVLSMEVMRDFLNDDESLAREIRIESS